MILTQTLGIVSKVEESRTGADELEKVNSGGSIFGLRKSSKESLVGTRAGLSHRHGMQVAAVEPLSHLVQLHFG